LCFQTLLGEYFMANTSKSNNNAVVQISSEFKAEQYASYIRSASANRASTFATLYQTTANYEMFREHAESVVLTFSTSTGVDTVTLGLVSIVAKLPRSAYEELEAKAMLNVQVKPSLNLNDEFAKLLIPFLTALTTVCKYCTVS
jgi:hypothetical protein